MDNARVIIIEDDPDCRELGRRGLERSDHTVIGEAATYAGALALIESLQPDDVDIAVVDGNLSTLPVDGRDGERVAQLIHEKLPNVTVIGWSADDEVRGADLNVPKLDLLAMNAAVAEVK